MLEALLELIKMQKECKIIIKRCDKGAGIIVLDYEEYMNACNVHLNSRLTNKDASTSPYYTKTDQITADKAKQKLINLLQEAKDNHIITDEENNEMCPNGKKLAYFYCIFKAHKEHVHGEAPPEQPTVSGCGATFENASKLIEHHIKLIATKHGSYLKDTPQFVRQIEEIN